jgi:hypothetical protein
VSGVCSPDTMQRTNHQIKIVKTCLTAVIQALF